MKKSLLIRFRALIFAMILFMASISQILLSNLVHADDNFIATINSSPIEPTLDTTPTFTFSTTYDTDPVFTFHCYMDYILIGECVSPFTSSPLESGEHTFSVNIIDSHGNFSPPVHHTWNINTEEQGDGSQEHPLAITNCTDWRDMANDLSAYYKLTSDIDCTGLTVTPIGNNDTPFRGNLDGNGYEISNVTMTNDGYLGTGLFGETNGASISALRITDSSIAEGEANGTYYVGGLAGLSLNSTFSDITTNNLNITATDGSMNFVGGLVGYLEGTSTIAQSYFDGIITNTSPTQGGTGGLVGAALNTSDVSNSYAVGEVHGDNNLGGLVGTMDAASSLRKSYSANAIYSDGENVGGLVGNVQNSSNMISHSFSVANLNVILDGPGVGSIAGTNTGTLSNNYYLYYDSEQVSILPCAGVANGVIVNCTGEESLDYFKGNSSNQPLSSFDSVWNLHEAGQLPSFAIGSAICDDPPTQSESTLVFGCEWGRQSKHHYSGNAVSREIRYRIRNSNDQWVYQDWPVDTFKILITGLLPATDYEVQFHTYWEIGTSDWESSTAWLTTGSNNNLDTDGDGIKDSIELNGPNYGDANGDSGDIDYRVGLDSWQANVTSLLNQKTNTYSVLQSDCTGNSSVSIGGESSEYKDTAFDYSLGLMNFTATGCGATATFTQYFYGNYDASKYTARKYNSFSHSYTTVPGAVLTNVTINGQRALKIVYQIIDNGPMDEDATVGTIKDPSGPAVGTLGAPNTGFGRK